MNNNIELDLSYKNLVEIPEESYESKKFKRIIACANTIKYIPESLYDINTLEQLFISYNMIENISPNINKLTKLTVLNLKSNKIKEFPYLGELTKLKSLNLNDNKFDEIPDENIKNLVNLQQLRINNNNLTKIPNSIKLFINLKTLDLSYNNLLEFPPELEFLTNLKQLSVSYNSIKKIPNFIGLLINLEGLYVNQNLLTEIPISIIRCIFLKHFSYSENVIENIPPQITRFLNKMKNKDDFEIYNDSQSVHNHSIQESVRSSIEKIMEQKFIINSDIIISELINDEILTETCKKSLLEYSEQKEYHSILLITFQDLLFYIWETIKLLDKNDIIEVKKILNIEMTDSECKCFLGRLSRLLNSLNGYSNLINITISQNQQIGNIIILIKNKLGEDYSIEEHKRLVLIELKNREISDNIIEEWLEYI